MWDSSHADGYIPTTKRGNAVCYLCFPFFIAMTIDSFYFSHDYNARNDDKIKQLIRRHGMEGYGVYWSIVEDLYQNANAMRSDCDGIAYDLHVHSDVVRSVLFDFNLFIHDGDMFGSLSIQKRIDERNERSVKARQSANKRWGKPDDANAMRSQCEGNAIKERKGKEIITDNKLSVKRFTPPTREDVDGYAKSEMIGSETSVDKFHDYYTANGWKVGRNAMKDWKAAFRNWVKNEKQYQQNGTHQQATDKAPASRRRADWDALAEWGKDIDQYRDEVLGRLGRTTN